MKHLLKMFLLMSLLLAFGRASAENVLVFEPLVGDESKVAQSLLSRVEFLDDEIKVVASDGTVYATYYKYDYRRIVFLNDGPTQVEEPGQASSIRVYPNPTHDAIRISGLQEDSKIALYNMQGDVVRRQRASGDVSLGVGALSNGVYILSINGETIKVIKQ